MTLADNLNVLSMDAEYFEDVIFRLPGAEQIASYFDRFSDVASFGNPRESSKFRNLANNIRECHRYWFFDHYEAQAVKDRKRVFMCHNKFCTNCQKIFAQVRKRKFGPAIDKFAEDYDLYHIVLTLPNCPGVPLANGLISLTDSGDNPLKKVIRHMSGCFKMLTRYLTGNAKIKGLDFAQYGFAGAIRSLECSFKRYGVATDDNVYHPHYHVIAAFRRGLEFQKEHLNQYSYSRRSGEVRLFSDFEILIQKIWRLLIDGRRVNMQNIFALDAGYSCMSDKIAPGNYHEVFKYAIKLDKIKRTDRTKADRLYLPLRNFVDLFYALYNVRTIQGYGVFHAMQFEDAGLDDITDDLYYRVVRELHTVEQPKGIFEFPIDIHRNIKTSKQIYISKNNMRSLLRASGVTPRFVGLIGAENISLGDLLRRPAAPESRDPEQIGFYDGNNILCHEDFEAFYNDQ
jgi:hypothetical protein